MMPRHHFQNRCSNFSEKFIAINKYTGLGLYFIRERKNQLNLKTMQAGS